MLPSHVLFCVVAACAFIVTAKASKYAYRPGDWYDKLTVGDLCRGRQKRSLGHFEGKKLVLVTKVVYDKEVRRLVASMHGARNVDSFLRQYYAMFLAFIDRRFQSLRDQGTDIHFRGLPTMDYIDLESIKGMNDILHRHSIDGIRKTACADTMLARLDEGLRYSAEYDHIILLSGYYLLNLAGNPVTGVTYAFRMCSKRFVSPSIVMFGFKYTDILTSAHEIMHAFGVPHDGEVKCKDARPCTSHDMYIMAESKVKTFYGTTSSNWKRYSHCTNVILRMFLAKLSLSYIREGCLTERVGTTRQPKQNYEYGSSVSSRMQCQRLGLINSDIDTSPRPTKGNICDTGLRCIFRSDTLKLITIVPYPGTVCDEHGKKWCDETECVPM